MKLEIRTIVMSDTEQKAEFDDLSHIIWHQADQEHFPEGLGTAMALKGEDYFAYYEDGVMLGFVHWTWEMGVAYIRATAVHPEYRRRGIATHLKEELERRVKQRLCHKIVTETGTTWSSREMNKKLNYSELFVIENHYGHKPFVYAEKLV